MKTIRQYLDSAAAKAGGINKLGRAIGSASSTTSQYHTGTRIPDPHTCLRLAEYLGEPFDAVLAAAQLARETDEQKRRDWVRLGNKLAKQLAVLLGALACLSQAEDGRANTRSNAPANQVAPHLTNLPITRHRRRRSWYLSHVLARTYKALTRAAPLYS